MQGSFEVSILFSMETLIILTFQGFFSEITFRFKDLHGFSRKKVTIFIVENYLSQSGVFLQTVWHFMYFKYSKNSNFFSTATANFLVQDFSVFSIMIKTTA